MKINKIIKEVRFLLLNLFFKLKSLKKKRNIKWLGNTYGGFYVDLSDLNKNSVIYSFGIGEDISFDRELIEKIKTKVYGFDPTPKSVEWVKRNKIKDFIFFDCGIGDKNEIAKMYLPKNKDYVSGSIVKNDNLSKECVNIKIRTLDFVMKELKHSHVNLLKLDIEGSEYDVLDYLLSKKISVDQIVVEFHDRFFENGKKRRKIIINKLKNKGYALFAISKTFEEYSFIKN